MNMLTMFDLLEANGNTLSDRDLAVLADWANEGKQHTPNEDWKRPFALIREGADLLLRRRARSSDTPTVTLQSPNVGTPNVSAIIDGIPIHQPVSVDYLSLRIALQDFNSTFYGPHDCEKCRLPIVRRALEQGGKKYDYQGNRCPAWAEHQCDPHPGIAPVVA
jgi:hypothetical protein